MLEIDVVADGISAACLEAIRKLDFRLGELPIYCHFSHISGRQCTCEGKGVAEAVPDHGVSLEVFVYLDRIGQNRARTLKIRFEFEPDDVAEIIRPDYWSCPEYLRNDCDGIFGFRGTHEEVMEKLGNLSGLIYRGQDWMVRKA